MFSKALFKQSCKANGTMWAIITFAVCFMLACVMLISGNGDISSVKDSIQDTIIQKEVDSQMEKRAVNYYYRQTEAMKRFDELFVAEFPAEYMKKQAELAGASDLEIIKAAATSVSEKVGTQLKAETVASVKEALKKANDGKEFADDSEEVLELVAATLYPVAAGSSEFADFPENYKSNYVDLTYLYGIIGNIADESVFINGEEHLADIDERAETYSCVFLAYNMTTDAALEKLRDALSEYSVTKEKFDSFGYTYTRVFDIGQKIIVTFKGRYDLEIEKLDASLKNGEINETEYNEKKTALMDEKGEFINDIAGSLLAELPEGVSSALKEVGEADLYTLIVGSIFYKLAGLLLPIIYMIMASNNLISGQVDSGSMAYVLSTSTKRKDVVFTQGVFLIGSLFAMFSLTTATGCVCLAIVKNTVTLTYGNLVLLNVGAFLVLFALSGLCFFTSCWFDRSKRSMAIGGGLSIFALVAAMLGLFGSPVIPSVVRLTALNNFNYTTIISLFDVISIMEGTTTFIWKFAILFGMGIIGYIAGSIRFVKKDLPL